MYVRREYMPPVGAHGQGELPLTGDQTLTEKYTEWKARNPHVLPLLRRFALEVWDAGHRRYSIQAVVHRVRWHTSIETQDPEGFKCNNDFTSRLARDLCRDPEHGEEFRTLFERRALRTR